MEACGLEEVDQQSKETTNGRSGLASTPISHPRMSESWQPALFLHCTLSKNGWQETQISYAWRVVFGSVTLVTKLYSRKTAARPVLNPGCRFSWNQKVNDLTFFPWITHNRRSFLQWNGSDITPLNVSPQLTDVKVTTPSLPCAKTRSCLCYHSLSWLPLQNSLLF